MAVTSYEVGAIFTIVNGRLLPEKITEQLALIDKQIAGLGTGASDMTAGSPWLLARSPRVPLPHSVRCGL